MDCTWSKGMSPGNKRRYAQLYDAALNLGMSKQDAQFYATQALAKELAHGDWKVVPISTEALANDAP
jgi:hypothetical protein